MLDDVLGQGGVDSGGEDVAFVHDGSLCCGGEDDFCVDVSIMHHGSGGGSERM